MPQVPNPNIGICNNQYNKPCGNSSVFHLVSNTSVRFTPPSYALPIAPPPPLPTHLHTYTCVPRPEELHLLQSHQRKSAVQMFVD